MERTLKEQKALKNAQTTAEEFEEGDADTNEVENAKVWAMIAIHEVLDRLVDVVRDGVEELEQLRRNNS